MTIRSAARSSRSFPALGVALVAAAIAGDWDVTAVWPFALAGILGPGISQVLFTLAIRDAGPSRASATVGMAPLFAVTFAARAARRAARRRHRRSARS